LLSLPRETDRGEVAEGALVEEGEVGREGVGDRRKHRGLGCR